MKITIVRDPYGKEKETHDVDDVMAFLRAEYGDKLPENTRIYYKDKDITPETSEDVAYLLSLDEIIIFQNPAAILEIIGWIAVALVSAFSLYTVLTMPKPQSQQLGSSNNELSNRVNKLRFNGRVPDIYGTVKAIPDLIANPILYYQDDGIEVEDTLMCIGRGHYDITDIKDGETFGSTIEGFSTSVYEPGTSLIGTPQIQIGEAFTTAPLIGKKSSAITGQTLKDPTESVIDTAIEGTMYPQYPNRLYLVGGGLDSIFSVGEAVVISSDVIGVADAQLSGSTNVETTGVITIGSAVNIENPNNYKAIQIDTLLIDDATNGILDLAGKYQVLSIVKSGSYAYEITLSNPVSVNPNWSLMTADNLANSSTVLTNNSNSVDISGEYQNITAVTSEYIELAIPVDKQAEWNKLNGITVNSAVIDIQKYTDNWLGWFYINSDDIEQLIFNFYFPRGLFGTRTDGKDADGEIKYDIEYQELVNNSPVGTIYQKSGEKFGLFKAAFGLSENINLSTIFPEGVRVRVRKTSKNTFARSAVYDEIKLKSVYACSTLKLLTYPDLTLVRARTIATDGALSIKERLWNCIATRKLPLNGTGALTATRSGAQALIHAALDDKNGRLSMDEVDIADILAVEQQIVNYFGSTKAAEFNYTIDDDNLSFEEIAGMIASTMFCEAYRFGSKLRIKLERSQENSMILFNHTNKFARTDKRTRNLPINNDYDGVELEYTSPDDDTRITYIASNMPSPTNPMSIKTSGIRTHEQAKARAWREWNKLYYQQWTCSFDALEESEILSRNDKILVADNTTAKTRDGIIDEVNGLDVLISQPNDLNTGYINIQTKEGYVDIIQFTRLSDYEIRLSRPPTGELALSKASYQIVETSTGGTPFLVTEIKPQGRMVNNLVCVNYDDRYYEKDQEFF